MLSNFYVCGPISMKLLPYLVSKVRKVRWHNGGKGPKKARKLKVHINMDNDWMYHVNRNRGRRSITLGVMSLGRFSFSNFAILENFPNRFLRT